MSLYCAQSYIHLHVFNIEYILYTIYSICYYNIMSPLCGIYHNIYMDINGAHNMCRYILLENIVYTYRNRRHGHYIIIITNHT